MADKPHEFTGKTVDEAVAEGLAQLRVTRSDVAVEVLSKGSRGIFGIGSEPARVRITLELRTAKSSEPTVGVAELEAAVVVQAEAPHEPTPEPSETAELETPDASDNRAAQKREREADDFSDDEIASMAAEMLGEIVRLMGFEAEVVSSWQEADEPGGSPFLLLDVEGEDLGALIGRRGETLANLQYLIRLMVNQRIKQWSNIVVDVEKYKERREKQLTQLALRMAEQVAESGRAAALEPMPSNERRLIHIALRDHGQVYTQSSGEGERRKVNIVPRDNA